MKNIKRKSLKSLVSWLTIASLLLTSSAFATATPNIDETLAPGESYTEIKTVTTPEIPAQPDIIFLADTTGSMWWAIGNVKTNVATIMNDVLDTEPDAQFWVAQYRDFGDEPLTFKMWQTVTANTWAVTVAVGAWAHGGWWDQYEAQLNALYQLSDPLIAWYRTWSTKIIVWFWDEPGHDPSPLIGWHTLNDVITSLQDEGITVIAIDVGNLDGENQAIAITDATDWVLLDSDEGWVADAIIDGLNSLPVTVTPDYTDCTELDISFNTWSITVTSGEDAVFEETITVPLGTPDGTTMSCEVVFEDENGNTLGTQQINIKVPDTTAPILKCIPAENPHGKNIPKAWWKWNGQNQDGFYQLLVSDNVDKDIEIFVNSLPLILKNLNIVKITEAPWATPKSKKMGSSKGSAWAIAAHLILDKDATFTATDAAGNTSSVTCLVPPMPK